MSIIVWWTMHYFVSVVIMLIVENPKIRFVVGRKKIN